MPLAAMSPSALFLAVVFGSLGFAYLLYGRRQRAVVPIVCGLLLLIIPYFVASAPLLLGIGCGLAMLPFFVRR